MIHLGQHHLSTPGHLPACEQEDRSDAYQRDASQRHGYRDGWVLLNLPASPGWIFLDLAWPRTSSHALLRLLKQGRWQFRQLEPPRTLAETRFNLSGTHLRTCRIIGLTRRFLATAQLVLPLHSGSQHRLASDVHVLAIWRIRRWQKDHRSRQRVEKERLTSLVPLLPRKGHQRRPQRATPRRDFRQILSSPLWHPRHQ